MEGYLDISGCSDKWRSDIGVDRIPVRIGAHQADIDVIEHRLESGDRERLRALMIKKYEDAGANLNKDLPIGFYLRTIPPGAALHLEG